MYINFPLGLEAVVKVTILFLVWSAKSQVIFKLIISCMTG